MSGNMFYSNKSVRSRSDWQFIQERCNSARKELKSPIPKKYLIPKKIHVIWLSEERMGEDIKQIIESWRRFHPTWKLIVWTQDEIEALFMIRQDLYKQAVSADEKFYIAQYEILYHFGGLVIDPQMECLKSLDQFHRRFSFYASAWDLKDPGISGSLLAAAPQHRVLLDCLCSLPKESCRSDYAKIYKEIGPRHLSKSYLSVMKENSKLEKKSFVFPVDLIFPWPRYRRWEESISARNYWVKESSYTFYHWDKTD